MTVAGAARIGLPIASTARTIHFTAKRRRRTIVASFRDAALGETTSFRARIDRGDGTLGSGVVLSHRNGIYVVRSAKRYRTTGWFAVTVTLIGTDGRCSVAHSAAVVRPR